MAKTMADSFRKLRVLVDMDGVLADFDGHFLTKYREKYPYEPFIPLEERRGFYVAKQYESKFGSKYKGMCHTIHSAKSFIADLPPVEGAIDAVKELAEMRYVDVFLATSPLRNYEYCVVEKFQWVEKYLGLNWTRKIILSSDKTVIDGHLLIDDKPNITGVLAHPAWKHVLFASYTNQGVTPPDPDYYLSSWTDGQWRNLIEREVEKLRK